MSRYASSLLKSGLSKSQVDTVERYVSRLSRSDAQIVVSKLERDIRFRNDFFEDPLTAIKKIGLVSTDPQPDIP